MILVSKFMVHRVLSGKTFLSLGLLSPLSLKLDRVTIFFHILLINMPVIAL